MVAGTRWFETGDLRFAAGIEDTFVVHEEPGRRKLDEYELTQHDHYWSDDLALAAETGASLIRWGIPWYRVNPAADEWDFSVIDRVVDRLEHLGLEPIVDLVHYGTPLWLEGSFAHPDYPQRVAAYAERVAERYRGRLNSFTPINEPLLNAIYCGEFGVWPPYLTGDDGLVRLAGQLARGVVQTQEAVTAAAGPDASFVHVEASYRFSGDTGDVAELVRFLRRRAFLMEDLVTGLVGADHPLRDWLLRHGMSEGDLSWHQDHQAHPDVMGVNYYPAVSTESFRSGHHPKGTLDDPRPRADEGVVGLREVLTAFAERYRCPVMLSETSISGSADERTRWLHDSVAAVRELRAAGLPVVGYTWWAVFDWVEWNFREGSAPVQDYLNRNGLWQLELDAGGVFRRVRSSTVDAYRMHATAAQR